MYIYDDDDAYQYDRCSDDSVDSCCDDDCIVKQFIVLVFAKYYYWGMKE